MKSYLIDTCVLIAWFSKRTASATRDIVHQHIKEDSILYVCGLVLAEFYRGIEKKESEYYSTLLEEFPYLHSARSLYEHAGLAAHELQKMGKTIPLGDCIVAETAKLYKAGVITFDKHFQKYPGLNILYIKIPR